MKLTQEEEEKLTEAIRQKIEKATPEELNDAIEFIEIAEKIRENSRKELAQKLLEFINKQRDEGNISNSRYNTFSPALLLSDLIKKLESELR